MIRRRVAYFRAYCKVCRGIGEINEHGTHGRRWENCEACKGCGIWNNRTAAYQAEMDRRKVWTPQVMNENFRQWEEFFIQNGRPSIIMSDR